ncbi:hypothetical protein [Flavobacterium undicola]|uniref:hypothetical protein n=1 Tax=Flavobacterium undicola TaxID=1932779 RepID=UPI001376E1F3|nr:hypothetical protein [Flavobacterium undicola]MBA0884441.1 hypothetical protein [Flavobacterium undicola]
MKNIRKIFAILTLLMLVLSCENDGGDSKIDTQYGAVIDIQKSSSSETYINLVALQNGGDINLGFTIDKAVGDIASIDVVGLYIKSDGTTIFKGKFSTAIKTFPYTLNINKQKIYDAFSQLNSSDDFETGDQLTISAELTLKDGTVLKLINDDGSNNFSPNIATSSTYKVFQAYNVSCPSSLGGTYQFTTTNTSAPTGEFAAGPLTGTVVFEDLGGGVYNISDASFGGWAGLYGPGNIAQKVQLKDICNKISYLGTDQYGEVFTFSNLVVNGDKISFHWENDYGEFGNTTLKRTDGSNWPSLTL